MKRRALKRRYGNARGLNPRLTRASARPDTSVRVADSDSMYRGEIGVILGARFWPRVGAEHAYQYLNRSERHLYNEGEDAVLVMRRNGSVFVIPAHKLERA